MSWWDSLGQVGQATVLSSAASAVAVIVSVLGGFVVTYKTSISATKRMAEESHASMRLQLDNSNRQKAADLAISWINELRSAAAELYRNQYELNLVKRDLSKPAVSLTQKKFLKERQRELNLLIAKDKRQIGLRINPASVDPDEVRLLSLLRKSVSTNFAKARTERKQIESIVNRILKNEWDRVKTLLAPQKESA